MSHPMRPPRLAAALISLVVPRGWAGTSLMADLEEEYRTRHASAPLRAWLWYWKAALQIAVAYGWERVRGREPVTLPAGRNRDSGHMTPGSVLLQDLRYALRSFRRTPGFTVVAVATLALGVGAASSVFSVADTVLLQPLPFPRPDRLVQVWTTRPDRGELREVVSGPDFLDWTRDTRSFSGLAAYRSINFNVTGGDHPERVRGLSVTPEFFSVLGVPAELGRLPAPDDADRGADGVVLSDAFWRASFGADPTLVGHSIIVNGEPRMVVAVLAPGFDFPVTARIYAPSPYRVPMAPLETRDLSEDRGAGYLSVVGRLADGVTVQAARDEMRSEAERLARTYAETNATKGASVVPVLDDMVGNLRPTFFMLLGAVGLLVLIACANVANLLTVRASRRRRELAVRVSLGASLGRVRRQLLTESVVLAFLGGVPGFFLSLAGTRMLVRLAPEGIPRLDAVSVDPRVLGFTLVTTLLTGLLFGLAPLVGLRGHAMSGVLREERGGRGPSALLRDGVVVAEVALSLLLVVGAGLMVRTLHALDAVDPGFDPTGVLVAHVSLPAAKYQDDNAMVDFYDRAIERIQAIPGVENAATVLTLPLHWAVRGSFGFSIQGRPQAEEEHQVAAYQVASPEYFGALRIPVLQGRGFEKADGPDAPAVVVVNETMARRFWPDGDVLGSHLTMWGDPDDPATQWATVVGVVGNTVKEGLDAPPEPEVYNPLDQGAMSESTFVLRTNRDPAGLAPDLRRAVAEVDPDLPLYGMTTMADVLSASLAQRRFRMILIGVFAGAALLLAAVGLYGVISFSVGQRTREIGIRMALGAARDSVVGQVVRQGLARVSVGIVFGVLASLSLRKALESQIFGVSPSDPVTYLVAVGLFAAVALIACLVPAARAARVDPAASVRSE